MRTGAATANQNLFIVAFFFVVNIFCSGLTFDGFRVIARFFITVNQMLIGVSIGIVSYVSTTTIANIYDLCGINRFFFRPCGLVYHIFFS